MLADVAVYLLPGLGAQGIIIGTGHKAFFVHKGDMPEGHVADDVMLYGCSLVLVDAGDAGQEGLASIFTNAHHGPTQIYVMMNKFHIRSGS